MRWFTFLSSLRLGSFSESLLTTTQLGILVAHNLYQIEGGEDLWIDHTDEGYALGTQLFE